MRRISIDHPLVDAEVVARVLTAPEQRDKVLIMCDHHQLEVGLVLAVPNHFVERLINDQNEKLMTVLTILILNFL